MNQPAPLTLYTAVDLLNIGHDRNRPKINIRCPLCGSGSEKKLNVDFEKDVFRCAKCGVAGKSVGFWALYRGLDPADLKAAARDYYEFAGNKHLSPVVKKYVSVPQTELAPIDTRDRTYRALLSLLNLKELHEKDLLRRGFTKDEIKQTDYKSYPSLGKGDIVKALLKRGCVLEGVPGFYYDNNTWKIRTLPDGYLIPQKNSVGQIQGFQVRLSKGNTRYVTLSTDGYAKGAPGKAYPHFVKGSKKNGKVILTEGPLKADLIAKFTGYSVLALQGVNATAYFPAAIKALKGMGYDTILLAFDMDMYSNEFVAKAFFKMKEMLTEYKMPFYTLIWDNKYKGLDDYLYHRATCKR